MKKTFALMLGFAALSACATQSGYEAKLNTYKGLTRDGLVSMMGAPAKTYRTNNAEYLTYYKDQAHPTKCETTFMIQDMRVSSWSFKGDECEH